MSARVLAVLREDAADRGYHVAAKVLLGIPLLGYCVGFVLLPHALVVDHENNLTVAVAKDGLRMSVDGDLPEWKLRLHSVCAMLLLVVCVFQKENVRWMATSARAYASWIPYHRASGNLAMVLILGMDLGGILMAENSTLEKFEVFIIFFALPFVCFGLGTYLTATPELMHYHRLFANMLTKGCFGTPLARLGGSLLQRQTRYFSLASGYYVGIGLVALVLGAWQVVELAQFFFLGSSASPPPRPSSPGPGSSEDDVKKNR